MSDFGGPAETIQRDALLKLSGIQVWPWLEHALTNNTVACVPFVMSVSTYPGTIALTRTLWLAYSVAKARVNPKTPAFDAAYATAP